MILAGRSFYEIEQLCHRRLQKFVLLSLGMFLGLGLVMPLQCVPEPLRSVQTGTLGPVRTADELTQPAPLEGVVEAMAARWLASGALRCVEFVIDEDAPLQEGPQVMLGHSDLHTPPTKGGPTVSIGKIIPLDQPTLAIELDKDFSILPTSDRGARTPDFAILHMVRPAYPQISLWANIEGMVTLKATISPAGTVTRVITLANEADDYCENVATAALLAWRFKRMEIEGKPVWFSVVVPFQFQIR
ncbi:MAG: TonB family protein [Candidatus Eisenbacteria sp.]|nr:TonB family protein [Candidatus Eisenbacteria bacterium]